MRRNIYSDQNRPESVDETQTICNKTNTLSKSLNPIAIMHLLNFFAFIGMALAVPMAKADSSGSKSIMIPREATYDIPLDFHYDHDFGIVDVHVEIPGANLKPDHLELPAHVKANASPIHIDETYQVNIYFKNDWTDAHRWEANIPFIGTLYVDLQSRIIRSNCKLGLRLHLTGTGILGRLEETVDLTEIDDDGIKFLAQGEGLCSS
ncbi:hypothetical protein V8C35DRAFT_309819 [Trichoderma chlorosporum]